MVLLQKYVAISSMCLSCVQINIMETTKPGVPRRRIWDRRVAAEAERLVEHLYSTLTWRHPQGVHSAKAEELQFQLSDNSITVAVTVMMAMGRRILRTIHCRRPPSRPPRVRDDVVKTGEELTLTGKPTELIELSSSRVDEIDNFNMPSRTTGDPPGVSTSIGTRSI